MNDADKIKKKAAKLKNPTPTQLPSGSWRCQITISGERVSFVDIDPSVAHATALAAKANLIKKQQKAPTMTVGDAIDRYIESKDSILSPSTILGYRKIRKTDLQSIMSLPLSALTQEKIQRSVNEMAKMKSPKSVRNAHGLLSSAISEQLPDMILRTTLPQKEKHDVQIPSAIDIEKIIEISAGTEMELPVLLALWLGLRASEIRGLTWACIDGSILHVKQAIVDGENGAELKKTKTYSGDRKIHLPEYVQALIEKQPKNKEYLVGLTGQAMYKRFVRLCERAGIKKFRFHDLRHANASVMLALGIPDKYAMERMGHATSNMLKTVYQHTMDEKHIEVSKAVDSYFLSKLHTKLHTN